MTIKKLVTLSESDAAELQAQADKYANGNASERIRQLIHEAASPAKRKRLGRDKLVWGRVPGPPQL